MTSLQRSKHSTQMPPCIPRISLETSRVLPHSTQPSSTRSLQTSTHSTQTPPCRPRTSLDTCSRVLPQMTHPRTSCRSAFDLATLLLLRRKEVPRLMLRSGPMTARDGFGDESRVQKGGASLKTRPYNLVHPPRPHLPKGCNARGNCTRGASKEI